MQGRPVHFRNCYNENNLRQAVKEVKEHRIGEAAQEFQVSKTTGRPTVLSEMEEKYLVKGLIVLGVPCFQEGSEVSLQGLPGWSGVTTRKKHILYYNITPA
jgi:hypothetical protein